MFYDIQFQWIHTMQSFWGGALNPFFILLNYLDKPITYILLICLVYFLTSVKSGLRFLAISIVSDALMITLKDFFHMPRPCQLDPKLALVCSSSFGFPSGGASASILYALIFAYHVKSPIWRKVIFIYPLLIAISRVYIGMHFVSDILGGFVTGTLVFLFYLYAFPYIEKTLQKIPLLLLTGIFHITMFLSFTYSFIIAGLSLGLWIASHYQLFLLPDEKWYKKGVLSVIGLIPPLLVYLFVGRTPLSLYLIGLWVSLGSLLLLRIFFPKTPKWTLDSLP